MWTLEDVLDVLNDNWQRATYGAVPGVVGGIARGVMGGRVKCHRDSWVVRKSGGLPGGYVPSEMHPELFSEQYVIDTPEELRSWLGEAN